MYQDHVSEPHWTAQESPVTRRRAVLSLGVAALLGASHRAASAQTGATPESVTPESGAEELGEARMPDWRFSLLEIRDPYTGALSSTSDSLPQESRLLAAQVILANHSQQPMEFMVTDVRLRDIDGVEYRAGDYYGSEPRIVSQNLPDGERTRGWVWFGIPESAEPMNIIFLAPAPILRIPLD